MKITKKELETLLASCAIQDKLQRDDFLEIMSLCRLAVSTGTVPEFLAAYETVNGQETAQGPAAGDESSETILNEIASVLAEMRAAGISHPHVRPQTGGTASDPMGTESYPDEVTVTFLGPDSDPVPAGCIVTMPVSFNRLPDETKNAILDKLDTAKSHIGDCAKRYRLTGTFPAGTVANGQTFREYADIVIKRAAAYGPDASQN